MAFVQEMNQIIADSSSTSSAQTSSMFLGQTSSLPHQQPQTQLSAQSLSPGPNSLGNAPSSLHSGQTSSSPSMISSSYMLNGTPESAEEQLHFLREFLNTAPSKFSPGEAIKRFPLTNNETISCINWRDGFYISGTDIVKILAFRFQIIGRSIPNQKKFEEGIFSDLRSLKPGVDAVLEEARSEFLEMLYKNNCIRTQKKQKVFFWYSVNHERLFQDALERDRKRESLVYPGHHHHSQNPMSSSSSSHHQQQSRNFHSSPSTAHQFFPHQFVANSNVPFMHHQQPLTMINPKSINSSSTSSHHQQQLQFMHSQNGTIDPLNLYLSQPNDLLSSTAAMMNGGGAGLALYHQGLSPSSYAALSPLKGSLPMAFVETGAGANSDDIQISFDDPSLCEFLNMSIDTNGLQFSAGGVNVSSSNGGQHHDMISAAF